MVLFMCNSGTGKMSIVTESRSRSVVVRGGSEGECIRLDKKKNNKYFVE